MTIKIYHATHDYNYSNWIQGSENVKDPEKADLIMFSGGTDVGPYLYGDKHGMYTDNSDFSRDKKEKILFDWAVSEKKPMLGICRGSQLLCALSGGKLIQHQLQKTSNGMHKVLTKDGGEIMITSSHHQAAFPYLMKEEDYEVVGWTLDQSPYHLNGEDEEISNQPFKEVEICFYNKTKALGIQGHPEWMSRKDFPNTFSYLDGLVERLLS